MASKYLWDASIPVFTTPSGRTVYLAGYYNDGTNYKNCSVEVWGTLPTDIIYAEQEGVATTNTGTENFDLLQDMLDNPVYKVISLGQNPAQIYEISQPLLIPDGKIFILKATLKIIDAITVALTQNVTIGDTIINVASSANFEIGQWVTVTDDILPVQGGAATQTRHVGFCSRIVDKAVGTITLKNASIYDVSKNDNGRCGQTQSVVIINSAENVRIGGGGWLDGNKSGQLDCEPVTVSGIVDPDDAGLGGMGLCCHHSKDVYIDNLNTINALVSNVSLGTGTNINYINCWSKDSHDKNMVLYDLEESFLDNIYCDNSDHEDGLTFYAQNQNVIVGSVICRDNPRIGLALSGSSVGCIVGNAVLIGNATGLQLSAKGMHIGQVRCEGGGTGDAPIYIYNGYQVNDCIFDSIIVDTPDAAAPAGVLVEGSVSGVIINSLIVTSLNGKPAFKADDFGGDTNYPEHIYVGTLLRYDCNTSDIDVNCTDVTVGKEMDRT